jgi:hypothetical protein
MIIVAKFASVCPCCSARIAVGAKVEWSKGEKARHVACESTATTAQPSAAAVAYSRAWGRPGRTHEQNQRAYDLDQDV